MSMVQKHEWAEPKASATIGSHAASSLHPGLWVAPSTSPVLFKKLFIFGCAKS